MSARIKFTLREKQSTFAVFLSLLIQYASLKGYEVTLGEVYRTPQQAAWNAKKGIGIKNSLHTKRLAADINLFYKNRWVKSFKHHKVLGDYWKLLKMPGIKTYWGGDFKSKDLGHFSVGDGGVQ